MNPDSEASNALEVFFVDRLSPSPHGTETRGLVSAVDALRFLSLKENVKNQF